MLKRNIPLRNIPPEQYYFEKSSAEMYPAKKYSNEKYGTYTQPGEIFCQEIIVSKFISIVIATFTIDCVTVIINISIIFITVPWIVGNLPQI